MSISEKEYIKEKQEKIEEVFIKSGLFFVELVSLID